MANGTIHKLGTLYVNNVKRPFPTKPWRTDSTPTGAPSAGNILNYDSVNGNIEIRNTDSDDAHKLRWVEVNDGAKKLLIADRCLLARVTWDELNAQGLVNGKEITIDGQKYKIRLLSGGNNYRSGSDNYSGGKPTTNEWDRIITNESSFSGLPKPTSTDLDINPNATDFNGAHNQFWNWYYMYSWCQEVYSGDSSSRVVRGCNSARYFNYSNSNNRYNICGWRPALEVLNSTPTINGANGNLGDYTSPLIKQYTISDSDNDKLSVTEKLDGVTIKSLTNQNSGTSITLDLTSEWNDISYGNHTIEIIVTDSNGLSSTATITFNKIKTPIQPIPTTSSLKQAINHSKEIDKEIEYLSTKLRKNLTDKGIEVLETDNMSNLIGKVGGIKLGKRWASGTSVSNSVYKDMVGMNGSSANRAYPLLVVGLDFKASHIYIYPNSGNTSMFDITIATTNNKLNSTVNGYVYYTAFYPNISNNTYDFYIGKDGSDYYVTSNSFSVPVYRENTSYTWVAYE